MRTAAASLYRDLEGALAGSRSVGLLADTAVLELLGGEAERATTRLEAGLLLEPGHGRSANDLAVASFESWRREGRPADLLAALHHARLATRRLPQSPAAWFNLGLCASALHLRHTTAGAFRRVLQLEPSGGWARETRDRLRSVEGARPADLWERHRRRLLGAAPLHDATIERLVRRFPTRVSETAEEDLLGRWAAGLENGAGEAEMLRRAERIGGALARRRGDYLLADGIAALRAAEGAELARLARAHRLLAAGLATYHRQDFVEAEEKLAEAAAAFSGTGSPYGHVAALYRAICVYYGDVAASQPSFRAILAAVPRNRYPSLAGRALWMAGTADMVQYRFPDAIASFAAMRSLLGRSSDPDQAAMVDTLLGQTYDLWGEVERGWDHRLRAFAPIAAWGDPRRRHSVLHEAAQALVRGEQHELALVFLDEVIANAKVWGQPLAEAEATSERARVRAALGDAGGAAVDARASRRAAARMPPGNLRNRTRGSALVSEGIALARIAPRRAARLLQEGYSLQRRSGWEVDHLLFLNAMAGVQEALGDRSGAEKFLLSAVESYEASRRGTLSPQSRIATFRQAQATFDRLIGLSLATLATDPGKAFDAAERARARYLLDAWAGETGGSVRRDRQPLSHAELVRLLPPRVTLVSFAQLPDKVVGWVAGQGSLRGVTLRDTTAERVDRLAAVFLAALEQRDDTSARRVGAELYELLIRPLGLGLDQGQRLVLIPEWSLQRIPFAALFDARSGRYLLEQATVSLAPSATLAVGALRSPKPRSRPVSVLVVAAPELARTEFADLSPLPGARREARAIAELYPAATVLEGRAARTAEVLAALPRHEIFHFGGHAVSLEAGLGGTFLLLAAGAEGDGVLPIDRLHGLALAKTRVVVLAACRSLSGFGSDREGPAGVAGAFFAAGASSVVAALWPVEDRRSSELLPALHRRIAAGVDAVQALRQVMLESLRSDDPAKRSPSYWAAYAALGV